MSTIHVTQKGYHTRRCLFAGFFRIYTIMFPFTIISEIIEYRPVRGSISTAMSSKRLGWQTFIQMIHSLQKRWIGWTFVNTFKRISWTQYEPFGHRADQFAGQFSGS